MASSNQALSSVLGLIPLTVATGVAVQTSKSMMGQKKKRKTKKRMTHKKTARKKSHHKTHKRVTKSRTKAKNDLDKWLG